MSRQAKLVVAVFGEDSSFRFSSGFEEVLKNTEHKSSNFFDLKRKAEILEAQVCNKLPREARR